MEKKHLHIQKAFSYQKGFETFNLLLKELADMIFTKTKIEGAYLLDIKQIKDERGFFGRSYCMSEFEQYGLNPKIVQVNVSSNLKKGTLRGLHMQVKPAEEAKLVRCTKGSIYDVLVDLRPQSLTFMQWIGVELTAESFQMLYVPEGCAHGYLTLADNTDVMYQVSEFYSPATEKGFQWNDPAFAIAWPIEPEIISTKDKAQHLFDLEQWLSTADGIKLPAN